MKVKLDFETPNAPPPPRPVERRPRPFPKQVCTYCFQPGVHQSAAECLRALERTS
jgi:hypothetical protein